MMEKERELAIMILDSIAEKLGYPALFDSQNGDTKWYDFEDLVTEILKKKDL